MKTQIGGGSAGYLPSSDYGRVCTAEKSNNDGSSNLGKVALSLKSSIDIDATFQYRLFLRDAYQKILFNLLIMKYVLFRLFLHPDRFSLLHLPFLCQSVRDKR